MKKLSLFFMMSFMSNACAMEFSADDRNLDDAAARRILCSAELTESFSADDSFQNLNKQVNELSRLIAMTGERYPEAHRMLAVFQKLADSKLSSLRNQIEETRQADPTGQALKALLEGSSIAELHALAAILKDSEADRLALEDALLTKAVRAWLWTRPK